MKTTGAVAIFGQYKWIRGVAEIGKHYSFATLGPVSVSAAHFLVSFSLLRTLPPADFGIFAFSLVLAGFCTGLLAALIGTPYTVATNQYEFSVEQRGTFFKASLLFSGAAGLAGCGIFYGMYAGKAALLFGLYMYLAMLRNMARSHAYAIHAPLRVTTMDLVYASLLLAGLGCVWLLHTVTLTAAFVVFVLAAAASVMASGRDYLQKQFVEAFAGRLRGYGRIWRDQARWMLLSLVSWEATINAHSYFVTPIAGPAAFAPIAAAALFMRPVSMCASSLTALERPKMARAVAEGDMAETWRRGRHFRWAIMLIWLASIVAAAAILLWFPRLIVTDSYDLSTIVAATALLASIEAIHSWFSPYSALLQAADKFRVLAIMSVRSGAVTMVISLLLLVKFGAVVSLVGVLVGTIVLAQRMVTIGRALRLET